MIFHELHNCFPYYDNLYPQTISWNYFFLKFYLSGILSQWEEYQYIYREKSAFLKVQQPKTLISPPNPHRDVQNNVGPNILTPMPSYVDPQNEPAQQLLLPW